MWEEGGGGKQLKWTEDKRCIEMGMVEIAQEAEEQKSVMDACRKTVRKTEQRNLAEQ
jgi:hypothetical protein